MAALRKALGIPVEELDSVMLEVIRDRDGWLLIEGPEFLQARRKMRVRDTIHLAVKRKASWEVSAFDRNAEICKPDQDYEVAIT